MLAQSSISIAFQSFSHVFRGNRNGTLGIKMEEWAKMGAL